MDRKAEAAKARLRYATDPKFRRYRRNLRKKSYRRVARKLTHTRTMKNGKTMPVYLTGHMLKKTGMAMSTILSWERKKLIPRSVFPGEKYRRYTARQIRRIIVIKGWRTLFGKQLRTNKYLQQKMRKIVVVQKRWWWHA